MICNICLPPFFLVLQPDLLKETVLHLHFWFLDIRLEQFLQQGKALHHIHLQFRSQKALNVQMADAETVGLKV